MRRARAGRRGRSSGQSDLPSAYDIFPPHKVERGEHFQKLFRAYLKGAKVTPVVAIQRNVDGRLVGLTGSHRIAAMREVFDEDPVPEEYVIVVPEDVAMRAVGPYAKILEHYLSPHQDNIRGRGWGSSWRLDGVGEWGEVNYANLLRGVAKLSPALGKALKDQIAHEVRVR